MKRGEKKNVVQRERISISPSTLFTVQVNPKLVRVQSLYIMYIIYLRSSLETVTLVGLEHRYMTGKNKNL